ncbi:TetR/AcrR family transcriptional regulator [Streptomyces thermospinosisporus]
MPAARESLLDAAYTALARRPWPAVRMVDVAASAGVSRQTLYNEFGSKEGLARALVRREADAYLAGVDRALSGAAAPGGFTGTTSPAGGTGGAGPGLTGGAGSAGPGLTGGFTGSTGPAASTHPTASTHLAGATSLTGPTASLSPPGPVDPRDRLTAAAEWTTETARSNALVRAMLTGCWSERLPTPSLTRVPSSSAVPAQRRADGPLPSPTDFVALVRDRAVNALAGPRAGAGAEGPDLAELARACELTIRIALSCIAAPPAEGSVADLVRDALHTLLSGPSRTAAARSPR